MGREECGSQKRKEKGSANGLKRGAWSIGIPAFRGEWGGWSFEVVSVFQSGVLQSKKKRKKKQGSLSVSVCLSPLWLFHLSLTNSSSGAQPLVDSLSRQQKTMATSAGRACPVPKVCPLWLPQLSGFGHRLESITKTAQSGWQKFAIEKPHCLVFRRERKAGLKSLVDHSCPRGGKKLRSSCVKRKWNLKNSETGRTRGWGSSLSVTYAVLSGLPLLTILARLLLMIQLCLHPSLLPPTPTSCF